MSPLRRHIFVCFMAKSAFWVFFRPQLRKKGSDPYSAWMKYVVCLHLYIPWKFGERGSTPRGATGPSLSFCFLFVRHATMLGTESLDGAYTHWTWGERASPRTKIPPAPDTQQAATYSIAAVSGNWTILVQFVLTRCCSVAADTAVTAWKVVEWRWENNTLERRSSGCQ